MTDFLRALYAEALKLKRTSALMLALVAPYTVVVLQALVVHNVAPRVNPQIDAWRWLGANCMLMWVGLMLPLFIALEAALLADLEHRHRTFKHLYSLPTHRGGFYSAKLLTTFALSALSLVLLGTGVVLAGKGLHGLHPTLGFDEPFPLALWARASLLVLLASWLIVTLHVWLSLRRLGFAPAIGLAVLATITSGLVLRFDEGLWMYFPWSLPMRAFEVFQTEAPADLRLLATSLIGGALVALLGAWDVTRQDVTV